MQQENILLTTVFLIIVQYILIKYYEFSLKAIQQSLVYMALQFSIRIPIRILNQGCVNRIRNIASNETE